MERIVILDPIADHTAARITALLPPGFTLDYARTRGEDAMRQLIADADYAISARWRSRGSVLRAAKKLKLLHKWGVGIDNLDLEAARALGIKVARTTGSNSGRGGRVHHRADDRGAAPPRLRACAAAAGPLAWRQAARRCVSAIRQDGRDRRLRRDRPCRGAAARRVRLPDPIHHPTPARPGGGTSPRRRIRRPAGAAGGGRRRLAALPA